MRLSLSILGTIVLAGCALHAGPAAPPAIFIAVPAEVAATVPAESGSPASPVTAAAPSSSGIAVRLAARDTSARGTVIPAGVAMAPIAVTPLAVTPLAVTPVAVTPVAVTPVAVTPVAVTPVATSPIAVSPVEVARRALDVFGDSLAVAPAAAAEPLAEPTWDMDVRSYETQDRVAHYVTMFSGRGRERIAERLSQGSRYEPMIRARMKAGGLPEDMYYLALVESGFDPNAYSRAAAVGMWQFMTSTGRGMGMRIDWWVDERRDPVRSTRAAVRFIRGLRDQFGSLYLAAAAYNGGPGRVARGLAKYSDDLEQAQGEDAFFILADKDYLKNETREYVPQLIAAALVAKAPARYGMVVRTLPPFAYDSVKVAGGSPLAAIAKAAGTSVTVIRELNPHFLRGMTPPGDRMQLRIPVGAAARFDSSFAALSKEDRTATRTVVSRKGQTVDAIADAYGISSDALEGFNPRLRRLRPSGKLVPGQRLVLPTPAVAAAALRVPDPSIEKYGRSTRRLRTHTVRRGETVRTIARKYGTTPERILKLNGLRKPMIFPGQDLIVSGEGKGKAGKSGKAASGKRASTHKSKAGSRTAGSQRTGEGAREKAPSKARPGKGKTSAKRHAAAA